MESLAASRIRLLLFVGLAVLLGVAASAYPKEAYAGELPKTGSSEYRVYTDGHFDIELKRGSTVIGKARVSFNGGSQNTSGFPDATSLKYTVKNTSGSYFKAKTEATATVRKNCQCTEQVTNSGHQWYPTISCEVKIPAGWHGASTKITNSGGWRSGDMHAQNNTDKDHEVNYATAATQDACGTMNAEDQWRTLYVTTHLVPIGMVRTDSGTRMFTTFTINLAGNPYAIAYKANGGTGTMANTNMTYGTAQTLRRNTFLRSGYKFAGWNTKTDGKGTAYTDQQSVNNLTKTPNGTVTLYAQWTPCSVTVKYNANGGTIASSPYQNGDYFYKLKSSIVQRSSAKAGTYENYTASVKLTDTYKNIANIVNGAGITRTGYHVESGEKYFYNLATDGKIKYYFNANNTAATDTNPVTTRRLNCGTEITADKTVTLYVNWKPNTYTVNYEGNGATAGQTAASTHTYNTAAPLSENGYVRLGYEFAGWNAKADGTGASYTDKQSVRNLTTANNGTVTLYAKWTPITYSIDYDLDGGQHGATHPSSASYDSWFEVSEPTREDHEFAGWKITGMTAGDPHAYGRSETDFEETTADSIEKTEATNYKNLRSSPGTVSFQAQWKPVTTVELYVDDLDEPWRTFVATPAADGTWDVPADLTSEAQRDDCTHVDGTPGLEAWFTGADFSERYQARTLEAGTMKLYARNWATVSYLHAGDADPARTYTAPDGTTGTIAEASKTPARIEATVGTVVSLGEIGNRRLTYDAGGAFPLTVVASAGWYADAGGTTSPFTVVAVGADTQVYKIWNASSYDGYVGQRS